MSDKCALKDFPEMAGRTVCRVIVHDDEASVALHFTDHTYIVITQLGNDDTGWKLKCPVVLNMHEQFNAGVITRDEYDQWQQDVEAGRRVRVNEFRRRQYDRLKAEFDP